MKLLPEAYLICSIFFFGLAAGVDFAILCNRASRDPSSKLGNFCCSLGFLFLVLSLWSNRL